MSNDAKIGISRGMLLAFGALSVLMFVLGFTGAKVAFILWLLVVIPVGIIGYIIRLRADTPAQ